MGDDLPAGSRIAIVAGGGNLPQLLALHLAERGHHVDVIGLANEAEMQTPTLRALGDVEGILRDFEKLGSTHAVLVGWVRQRPRISEAKIGWRTLRALPALVRGLYKGDDGMLRAAVGAIEARGVKVVGVHQLWPELVAKEGRIGGPKPTSAELEGAALGQRAAKAVGSFDIGQALVVAGRHIVAVEGLEGTDAMVRRVGDLRRSGRLRAAAPSGVLVKVAKPDQETRVDLPSIGPDTVRSCQEAGLSGIVVEAGRSLVLERDATVAAAGDANIFVYGLAFDEA